MAQTIALKNQVYTAKKRNKQTGVKSVYIPFSTMVSRADSEKEKELKTYGIITHKKPKINNYVMEIDASKSHNSNHVHIWRASDSKARLSDTRSVGVNIFSGLSESNDIAYSKRESYDKRFLKDAESKEIYEFLQDENVVFAIFCIINLQKNAQKISVPTLDIDRILLNFSEREALELYKQFEALKQKEKLSVQFGE